VQLTDLAEADRAAFVAQDVESALLLPLFQRLDWWGVLQLDQSHRPRTWAPVEVTALQNTGRLLGAAMELQRRQQVLQTGLYLLERTFDSPRDGIVLVSASGQIVAFNRQFTDMWQVPETIVAGRDAQQTLAHVLSQVKAPQQFLRAVGEANAAPESESYDLIELVDGRLFERISEPQPLGWDGTARMWRFHDITDGSDQSSDHPSGARAGTATVAIGTERDVPENERLRVLSLRLEQVREDERKRLARELHDQLGQALTGLKLDLSWLSGRLTKDYEALHDKAQAMSEMVSTTIQTVRRISTELRPPILDDLGLPAAVEWQAREFETRSGVSCTVDISPEVERGRLEQARATAVFRIFQEILTNVARHAGATAIHVSLATEDRSVGARLDKWVVLSVRDNGRGISEAEANDPRSMGLAGMRERALVLHGMITVEAMPAGGTTVTVRIPFEMEKEHD
jgi:signal transduction histidine kinase